MFQHRIFHLSPDLGYETQRRGPLLRSVIRNIQPLPAPSSLACRSLSPSGTNESGRQARQYHQTTTLLQCLPTKMTRGPKKRIKKPLVEVKEENYERLKKKPLRRQKKPLFTVKQQKAGLQFAYKYRKLTAEEWEDFLLTDNNNNNFINVSRNVAEGRSPLY